MKPTVRPGRSDVGLAVRPLGHQRLELEPKIASFESPSINRGVAVGLDSHGTLGSLYT